VLFQQLNLVGHLSVDGNIALAQRLAGRRAPAAARAEILARCGIGARAHARPRQLSGGELARAGLAVALANAPAIVLADEPTGELDSATAERVLDLLRERASEGAAVVVVTHDPEVAATADREIRLRDGSVAA
jgi:putative ABC transport system ATP-binding protein